MTTGKQVIEIVYEYCYSNYQDVLSGCSSYCPVIRKKFRWQAGAKRQQGPLVVDGYVVSQSSVSEND